MSSLHPQVAALLERAARSPLPPYDEVPPAVESVQLRLVPGPAGPVPVRAYRPKGAGKDELLPVLVYFHGGGWVIGDLDTHDVVCRALANGARCAVFSVEYRKAPEAPFPAAVDDCFAAFSYVVENGKNLNIETSKAAVGGDSAGGNLATVIALMTAGFDPLLDEGRAYAERMKKEGVPVEYREYAGMVHGFITMGRVLDTANEALADCARALKKAWGSG